MRSLFFLILLTIGCGQASQTYSGGGYPVPGPPGPPGPTGPSGSSQYGIIEVIDPCGPSGTYDEVLLRLENGQLLAHYASSQYQFLTLIGTGNYVTTDTQVCHFTVHNDLSVSW